MSYTDSDHTHSDLSRSSSSSSNSSLQNFAQKLGYSNIQLETALNKLGPNPCLDELLSELIIIDSKSEKKLETDETKEEKRKIIIDGSNVAMNHGQDKNFSWKGIELAVDYFVEKGHEVTVFVPSFRKEEDDGCGVVGGVEKKANVVFTPSRSLENKKIVCYDDRYILKFAAETDGIVVSNDCYRDLISEFKRVIERNLLMFSFVGGRFQPPEDPLGRNGPSLQNFLNSKTNRPPCPYGTRCTYGSKCKYYHPTQPKSITETLRAAVRTQSVPIQQQPNPSHSSLSRTKSVGANPIVKPHKKLQRELSINPAGDSRLYLPSFPDNPVLSSVWSDNGGCGQSGLYFHLCAIFPEEKVLAAMKIHPGETDAGVICSEILKN